MKLLLKILLFAVVSSVFAQPYPKNPVRVILPFPAGGGVDAAGRVLAQALTVSLGKAFVIENRGGANGNIGTEAVAKAPADGYTLLFTGAGFVTNPSLYKKVPYDPVKDFEPVRPGEIGFAGSGSGSTPHLAGELFNVTAGVKMIHIPYRGSGPAMIGLLAGDAPVMFLPAINAGPQIAAGRVRALAVTSRERLPAMPDLPTVAESGLPGYESSQWYGVLAPAGTPPEILDFLGSHIRNIMRDPAMRSRMSGDGLVPIGSSREQFRLHIKTEIEKWAKLISASGATVD
jgi:tripartite-type tricarboxylate transporter receptor subunit TctC